MTRPAPDGIDKIFYDQTYTLKTHLTDEWKIGWTLTVQGDDFLDGPWEDTFEGVCRKGKTALEEAAATLKKARAERKKQEKRGRHA